MENHDIIHKIVLEDIEKLRASDKIEKVKA